MKQTYTFEELVAWKARSTDPNEQKKIRRLIRELRAADPSVPALRRGISRGSGVLQPTVDVSNFNPADRSTWPTTGNCRRCKDPARVHKRSGCTAVHKSKVEHATRKGVFLSIDEPCRCVTYEPDYDGSMWTLEMHDQFIDWMAVNRPLHVVTYVNKDGVPTMGCDASCCSTKNWALYDQLMSEFQPPKVKKTKLEKAAKKAAKKLKVKKVSSV